jgi:hypothetical protein
MLSFKPDPTALHLHSPFIPRSLPPPPKEKPRQDLQEPQKLTKKTQRKKPLHSGTPTSFSTRHKIQESFFPESSLRHRPHKSLFFIPNTSHF